MRSVALGVTDMHTMTGQSKHARTKNLRGLLAGCDASADSGSLDVEITDLTLDSRAVQPGAAFAALPGTRTHGIGFAAQAVSAGARAILWEPSIGVAAPRVPSGVALIAIPELTGRLGEIADRFFDEPSKVVQVMGVTGTNGKTTTAHVIAAAMQQLGVPSAYAGTIGYGRIDALDTATHTTPDCITVHRRLAELRASGVRCLSMEVSSHALDQHRVGGVRFHTAVFTNLTRDHLDYHGTIEAYGAAKARLFEWPGLQHAVVNVDDAFGRELVAGVRAAQLIAYSAQTLTPAPLPLTPAPLPLWERSRASAGEGQRREELYARQISAGANGLDIEIDGSWGAATLRSHFIGDFNVENLLAVMGALLASGVPLQDAVAALEQCKAPPGRMETLGAPGRPLAVVDYAHTPDALEKALLALRQHLAGRLVCVFGCGGDRDPGKRPMMGGIAEQLADRVIVTDDNPRTEDGNAIVADILKGLQFPEAVLVERDRATAIARAIDESEPGDVVLIAGKGHEDYQIVGAERRHFSDREVALAVLGRQP